MTRRRIFIRRLVVFPAVRTVVGGRVVLPQKASTSGSEIQAALSRAAFKIRAGSA